MWLLLAISMASLPQPTMKVVREEAKRYGFDPLFVAAVIYRESRFRNSTCFKGSHGLMQIQLGEKGKRTCRATLRKAQAQGLYDPRTNIRRGLKLMAWWRSWWRQHHRHEGYHWLLHYNQGFGRCPARRRHCEKTERVPVTRGKVGGYADRVLEVYEELRKAAGEV